VQNLVHIDGRALAQRTWVGPIRHQAPRLSEVASIRHRREPVLERQRQELLSMRGKEGGFGDHKGVGSAVDHGGKGRLEGRGSTRLHALELHAQGLGFPLDITGYEGVARPGRIDQDGHPGDGGDRLLEQLQTLPGDIDRGSSNPVRFPPGCARLATSPCSTIPTAAPTTMGIDAVTRLAAHAAGSEWRQRTSGVSGTRSAASAGSRSACSSPYR
jgi:hypothetical protein